jgi:hypothetical protein
MQLAASTLCAIGQLQIPLGSAFQPIRRGFHEHDTNWSTIRSGPWLGHGPLAKNGGCYCCAFAAIIFGAHLCLAWLTLLTLILLFGAYALVDGVLAIIRYYGGAGGRAGGWLLSVCLVLRRARDVLTPDLTRSAAVFYCRLGDCDRSASDHRFITP